MVQCFVQAQISGRTLLPLSLGSEGILLYLYNTAELVVALQISAGSFAE